MALSRIKLAPILAVLGCGPGGSDGVPVEITGVTTELSDDVVTVVTVRWQTSEPVAGRVRFGTEGERDRVTPDTAVGTDHTAVLVGLPAEAEVSLQVEAGDASGEVLTATTGSLPADVPGTVLTGAEGEGFLLTTSTGSVNWLLMLDPLGRVVWYHADERGLSVFRARVSADGSGVVYTSVLEGGRPSDSSEIVRVPWAGGSGSAVRVPALAHDFVELEEGTVVSLASPVIDDIEGSSLLAVEADGAQTELWNTWDCLDPIANAGDVGDPGWTHANAVDRDPDSGGYFVGLRNLGTIVLVDPTDRSCPWALGGSGGTLDIDGARFIHEHQFERTAGGMLVFDNDGAAGSVSRGIEYAIDLEAGTASEMQTFEADPPLYSFIMGDVHRFANGDTLVLFSAPNVIDRYDAGGARVGRLEIDGTGPLGFASVLATPYLPGP